MINAADWKRRWIVRIFGALVLILLYYGVRGTVRGAIEQLSQYDWQVRPAWLIASGALYVVGLVPMAAFWNRALFALGQPAPWLPTWSAYFLGHVAKYVPGKALTVVLRVTVLRKWVPSLRAAVVSVMLETLTLMAVGAVLAAVLSIALLQLESRLAWLAIAIAMAAGLPTLPPIARRIARFGMTRLEKSEDVKLPPDIPADVDASLHGIDLRLLAVGWLSAGACWVLLGLSLWALLRAIGVEQIRPLSDLPLMIATVAFSVVGGFASQLPGGLGVRDLLLMRLLVPVCGEGDALVATALLRLVWLVSEVAACGILYIVAPWAQRRLGSDDSATIS